MSENKKNEQKQKSLTRLSLSGTPSSKFRTQASTVTVEVHRKRVSLLDKKRALEDNKKIEEEKNTKNKEPVEAPITGTLSEVEIDSRLKAVKKAAIEKAAQEAEKAHQKEEFLAKEEENAEETVTVQTSTVDTKTKITETDTESSTANETIKEKPSPFQKVNKQTKSGNLEKTGKKSREEVSAPIVPVILRAASYGPSKKILEKQKKTELKEKEVKQDDQVKSKTSITGEPIDKFSKIQEPLVSPSESRSFGKIKSRRDSEDTDVIDKFAYKPSKKSSISTSRKLTRTILTRVMEGEEEVRFRSAASYRRAQKKRFLTDNKPAVRVIRDVIISDTITVGELANRMAVGSGETIKVLMKLGITATINQVIDGDTAELLCAEFGHRVKRVASSDIEIGLKKPQDKHENLKNRPPVITVMGHVDHGKTSLLDSLRKSNQVLAEFGGITQHIGAYQIITPFSEQKITFIDTPGHAAFSSMRARGANITDIVVLVVAADDGVKEQTIEAISHAKASGAAIILAINKIDKPTANSHKVKCDLINYGIVTEEFGGDIISVDVSAKNGTNIDKLVEAILLQAEILELKANPEGLAEGTILESSIDKGRGITSTVLVQRGTLKIGDIFIAGAEFGKIKVMKDSLGRAIEEAPPSCPVEVLGFNGIPEAGDELYVVETEQRAREIAEYRQRARKEKDILAKNKNSIEHMMDKIAVGEIKELPIVLKTDVQGTLEAIEECIKKLTVNEVFPRIIHKAIGNINETDIMLAKTSEAVVLGFNVKIIPQARLLAEKEDVFVSYYSVIYELLKKVESMMKGLLAPKFEENILGRAEIRVVFTKGKFIKIAGCYVTNGIVRRSNSQVRVFRNEEIIFTGTIDTMKREQNDIKESKEGYDCGIIFQNFNNIQVGDIVECFEMVQIVND